jgi:preprotein translocase subunit YajC
MFASFSIFCTQLGLLFAQEGNGDGSGGAPPGGQMTQVILMIGLAVFAIYFLMIRPQQKQAKQMQTMLGNLRKNDRVFTIGGIIGTVHNIAREQNEIVLKVDEGSGTKMRFRLNAIAGTLGPQEGSSDADKEKS